MNKWTKEQEEAITKTGSNIIVSAGAGSGKTAVLTERTIRKLLNGGSINRLLILTFTNAAAGEMKDRIRKAIKSANLKEELEHIDSSYITTFDSFALSIVKKYHTTLNIPKDISIMDSSIQTLKTNEIMDELFEELYGDADFDKLIGDFSYKTDETIKSIIIDINEKISLIKDKENFLKSYIDTHFKDDVIDEDINKYLDKINKEINLIKEDYYELTRRVDNKYIDTFNIDKLLNSKTYDEIKLNLSLKGSPRKNKNCAPDFEIYKDRIDKRIEKLNDLTRFSNIDEMKSTLLLTKPYISAIIKVILKFDERFSKYKNEKNLYTFQDVALMAIKIIKENPDIRDEVSNSFDEIMVDEYQDTNDIQEEFINLISNNNVYMVGDIKQSIYRFRHANPYIFRNKYENYSKGIGGIKIDLLKNFRSRSEVLDNINLIFNLIMDNELGDADYKETHQMNFGNTSYIEEFKTNTDNNMEILTYDKKSLEYKEDEIEAFTVAYDIKEKIENKYLVVGKEKKLRPCTYKDFAIIMDRGSSFDLYKKIFEYVGIPIIQIKNEKLTLGDDIIAIKNLINLIVKVNLNIIDDEFKYLYTSVCRSYLFRIPDEEIFDIIKSNNYYDTLLFKNCKSIDITEISNIDFINKVIDEFNIYEKLITIGNIDESMIRIDYLKDLSVNLSNIGYTVIDFSQYLSKMIEYGEIEYSLNSDSSDSVKILNIHKSKGLEFNICYYTGLSKLVNTDDIKSRFVVDSHYNIITPYNDNGLKQTILKDLLEIEELRETISEKIRLFYVALTRAKEKMIIVCSNFEKESYDDLVPCDIRLTFNKIKDMLDYIHLKLEPFIKEIDFKKVVLTHDYEKIKKYNYKNALTKVDTKITKITNNIDYELKEESKFSKTINKLITLNEYENMIIGTKMHYIFETEDFKTTKDPYILKFLSHIDNNYTNIYKEYEFIYEDGNEVKSGIIDLMLEYENNISIIDYKMKNINDENYIRQLNGYKSYVESITKKEVNIYLYSILGDTLEKLT